ncbi:hypothetical protein CesoFtcFv8_020698 [Champsocephalus esox]|uniref:Uncharacterized protein n=1 Tax=Champsocephalus esox TaxID=159716 RepID=A0AAN8BC85_9TELE|nr:hypothetical protein CesoFtcFv8_020698 [Champsocephalus esox]
MAASEGCRVHHVIGSLRCQRAKRQPGGKLGIAQRQQTAEREEGMETNQSCVLQMPPSSPGLMQDVTNTSCTKMCSAGVHLSRARQNLESTFP